ncbi:MAG: hypothetical protein NVS3B18_08780 [Candidatus Dormibacteria bacterium]
MKLVELIGTRPGRLARVIVGVALVGIGLRSHGVRRGLAVVGLIPLAAGLCDVCVLGPVVGRPFQGEAFRRSAAHPSN